MSLSKKFRVNNSGSIPVIGITGGIGAGKSKASRYIAEKGYVIIDADQIGRDMTADGQPVLKDLNEIFGPRGEYGNPDIDILIRPEKKEGLLSLDRAALADLVFNDAERKKIFDAFMHRKITELIDERIRKIRSGKEGTFMGILLDAPLLFEAHIDDRCDVTVLITADERIKINRIMKRDGMSEEHIRARMKSQMSDSQKERRCDFVIDNSGNFETLKKKLDKLIMEIENSGR